MRPSRHPQTSPSGTGRVKNNAHGESEICLFPLPRPSRRRPAPPGLRSRAPFAPPPCAHVGTRPHTREHTYTRQCVRTRAHAHAGTRVHTRPPARAYPHACADVGRGMWRSRGGILRRNPRQPLGIPRLLHAPPVPCGREAPFYGLLCGSLLCDIAGRLISWAFLSPIPSEHRIHGVFRLSLFPLCFLLGYPNLCCIWLWCEWDMLCGTRLACWGVLVFSSFLHFLIIFCVFFRFGWANLWCMLLGCDGVMWK